MEGKGGEQMNIDHLLLGLGYSGDFSYTEIRGGKDSMVFKLVNDDNILALRIISSDRLHQFMREKKVMELARERGIPTPKVYTVKAIGKFAAMVMDWVPGKTVLSALQEDPACASVLGFNFGRTQARINQITLPHEWREDNWLTPVLEEKEILKAVSPSGDRLLHLDYHPLNVMTDGVTIVGVIDWMNAARGDYRFDFSRTYSILELEGSKVFQDYIEVLHTFQNGWREGYVSILGTMEDMSIFHAWAGKRMQRDMANRILPKEYIRIERWIQSWIHQQ